MTLETKAWKYIADWDEIRGNYNLSEKAIHLRILHAAQFSEFVEDFDDDENKCLENMYQRIIDEVEKINPEAWDNGVSGVNPTGEIN